VASDRFAEARELVAGLDAAAQALGVAADFALVADLVAAHAPPRTLTPALPAAVTGPSGPARPHLDRTATDWSTPPPAPKSTGRPARAGWRLLGVAAFGLTLAGGGWALSTRTPRVRAVDPAQKGQLSPTMNRGPAAAPPSPPGPARVVAPDAAPVARDLAPGGSTGGGAGKGSNAQAAAAPGAGPGGEPPRRSPRPRGSIEPSTGAAQGGDPPPRTTSDNPTTDAATTNEPPNVGARRATRSPPPDALSDPAAPRVKIWDVDSPLPPP
jgi:hypothetical protein